MLRHLNLSCNTFLEELPKEIGNLIQLRYLNLKKNVSLEKLPKEIRNLSRLRYLNLSENESLEELPESIQCLRELQVLKNYGCMLVSRFPEGLAQLTGLRLLSEFRGGCGQSKLGILKNLNSLGGSLKLCIRLGGVDNLDEVVKDAREAELRNKIHMEKLQIIFYDHMDENESSSSSRVRMDVMDALEPHPNLREVRISSYRGPKFSPGWMISPLSQVRKVTLSQCYNLTSMPHLGKLPHLERIEIYGMSALEIVGREFMGGGGGGSSSNGNVIAFPKLESLTFDECYGWNEWENITTEEEESATFQVMPCLSELEIKSCHAMTKLPHRLLRKALSLKTLNTTGSAQLHQLYGDKGGSDWKSISFG